MTKRINTEKAPAAIGPYSQGVAAGNFLFVSGQLPIDPKTGSIDADNVADQARQSLTNLSQILEAAGTSMDKVVKTTVFIQHMDDFAVMNEVYAQFFQGEVLPARQRCGGSQAAQGRTGRNRGGRGAVMLRPSSPTQS